MQPTEGKEVAFTPYKYKGTQKLDVPTTVKWKQSFTATQPDGSKITGSYQAALSTPTMHVSSGSVPGSGGKACTVQMPAPAQQDADSVQAFLQGPLLSWAVCSLYNGLLTVWPRSVAGLVAGRNVPGRQPCWAL